MVSKYASLVFTSNFTGTVRTVQNLVILRVYHDSIIAQLIIFVQHFPLDKFFLATTTMQPISDYEVLKLANV